MRQRSRNLRSRDISLSLNLAGKGNWCIGHVASNLPALNLAGKVNSYRGHVTSGHVTSTDVTCPKHQFSFPAKFSGNYTDGRKHVLG